MVDVHLAQELGKCFPEALTPLPVQLGPGQFGCLWTLLEEIHYPVAFWSVFQIQIPERLEKILEKPLQRP